jgi:hypothetical protein
LSEDKQQQSGEQVQTWLAHVTRFIALLASRLLEKSPVGRTERSLG